MNSQSKKIIGAALLCTLIFTSGCASTLMRSTIKANGGRTNVTYPSVRMAGDSLENPSMLTPLILLDLPFSFALDTLMLPADAANTKRPKKTKPEVDTEE